MGWQTYSVVHPDAVQEMCGKTVQLVEDLPKQLDGSIVTSGSTTIQLPKSACLGVLGITGLTAHIALTKVAKAQPGETLVISSGAGQIGHLVGQIGKILGLHVIGKLLTNFL
jgi:NADPH-dependent curcumin reductase CurA